MTPTALYKHTDPFIPVLKVAYISTAERPQNALYTRLLRGYGWIDDIGRPTW